MGPDGSADRLRERPADRLRSRIGKWKWKWKWFRGRFDGTVPIRSDDVPPWLWVALPTAAAQALAARRVLGLGDPPPLRDSIIFEYYGWYVAEGATLYVDAWEFKPPLPFEFAAVLAVLAGDDVRLYHLLNVAASAAAAVACAALVATLVREMTGERRPAVVAGISLSALPGFVARAGYGMKPKYFVLAWTLLAVVLARRDRPLAAGLAAAAAAGTWQLGAVTPVLAALAHPREFDRRGRRRSVRLLAGTLAGGLVVVAPVLLAGRRAVTAMVVETVLAPVLLGDPGDSAARVARTVAASGFAGPILLGGGWGIARAGRRAPRESAPVVAGTAWFLFCLLVLDFDAAPDLFVLLGFACVGFGLLVADPPCPRSRPWSRGLSVVAVALALAGVVTVVGVPGVVAPRPLPDGGPVVEPSAVTAPYNLNAERRALYWHRLRPETCHVFPNRKQWAWLELTGRDLVAERCGRPPPGFRWLDPG